MRIYQRLYIRMYNAVSLALEKAEEGDWADALTILREAQKYTREEELLEQERKRERAAVRAAEKECGGDE